MTVLLHFTATCKGRNASGQLSTIQEMYV